MKYNLWICLPLVVLCCISCDSAIRHEYPNNSCNISISQRDTESIEMIGLSFAIEEKHLDSDGIIESRHINEEIDETQNCSAETEDVKLKPQDFEESLENNLEQALILTDHLIHCVMTEDWLNDEYSYSDEDIWKFVISLCLYNTQSHPYNNMLIIDTADYRISFDNAIRIAQELFSCENWKPINYNENEKDIQQYIVENGVGLWNRTFTYEIISKYLCGDIICVNVKLISGSLFGEEELNIYGSYSLAYQCVYTDAGQYLKLISFSKYSEHK